ncbi:TPA: DUF551 domain-containing protein [Klebsiella pneumoniae]|uniref:DUF551 domain-containing protein n=1 Tax=Klebsiella pneumoniae TaxID=573 RepID=UPI003B0373AF|nr:DUF551 domain-containing protein [Klebsiella pneumoniae]
MTSKFSIDNRELLQRISSGEAVAGIDFGNLIVRELAAFRLAAMDSEPVAWLRNPDQGFHLPMLRLGSKDPNPNFVNEEFYPVYAAPQPEPVVPDENTLRIQGIEALEEFLTATTVEPEMLGGIKLTLACCRALKAIIKNKGWADFNDGKPEKVKAETIITALSEPHSDACRAAMLQAGNHPAQSDFCPAQNHVSPEQNGDTPAQSQGWIQVSEQMPPSRHEVLVGCWWGEKPRWCCKWATYIPGHPDTQSSGWLIPGASWTPTHWMDLPAAPQEPKP